MLFIYIYPAGKFVGVARLSCYQALAGPNRAAIRTITGPLSGRQPGYRRAKRAVMRPDRAKFRWSQWPDNGRLCANNLENQCSQLLLPNK